jgi:PhoH-like ATPase
MSRPPAPAIFPLSDQTDLFHSQTRSNGHRPARPKTASFDGLKAPSAVGKNFVIDTNVLLHDPGCIGRFADNHVCIPVEVLCELDRFKGEQSERGANARAVHRELAELFSAHRELATRGIPTPGGGTVRLVNCDPSGRRAQRAVDHLREMLTHIDSADHRLLLCTKVIGEINAAPCALVTKDLNLQLKALALGIPCEDYLSDKVQNDNAIGRRIESIEIEMTDLQRFASTGVIDLAARHLPDLAPNEYVLLQAGDKRTMPARHTSEGAFHRLRLPETIRIQKGATIRPLNLGQQCFLDALLDPEISLVTCYGQAGTGKTLLAVAAALHATFAGAYAGVTVSRPVVPLGDTLGFLPGSIDEKLHPWLKPIFDALEFLTTPPDPADRASKPRRVPSQNHAAAIGGGAPQKPYQPFLDSGLIEVEALCYIRGRSIPNRFFILDEAQQLTPLEAKTIVTRMARGSKLVMVGDPAQIDNPYVDRRSNGLVYTRERLEKQTFTAHVTLERGERSDLAEAGARLM